VALLHHRETEEHRGAGGVFHRFRKEKRKKDKRKKRAWWLFDASRLGFFFWGLCLLFCG